jgi:quinol monooxygenase YgiN
MIKVIAPEGLGENLVDTVKPLMGSIRARAGCVHCHIYQDSQDPKEMALLQEWESESAFAAHVGSKDYRYILEWMDRSAVKPRVTICKNLDHGGFKVIKNLLNVVSNQTKSSVAAGRARSDKPL